LRAVLLAIGIVTALLVLIPPMLDEGEVVILVTQGDDRRFETPLWIVEVDGHEYLRAAEPDSEWLERLREEPSVELRPEDEEDDAFLRHYTAEPTDDAAIRRTVNDAMAAKYGFADFVWGRMSRRANSIPILLTPNASPPAEHASTPESGSANRSDP
jgi:hypothetical protein